MVTCLSHGDSIGGRAEWGVGCKGCGIGGAKLIGAGRVGEHPRGWHWRKEMVWSWTQEVRGEVSEAKHLGEGRVQTFHILQVDS